MYIYDDEFDKAKSFEKGQKMRDEYDTWNLMSTSLRTGIRQVKARTPIHEYVFALFSDALEFDS
jgi:hypothetical protein